MKKWLKIIIGVISIIIILTLIDLIFIFTTNIPLFAIKENGIYKGIFYDTYNCSEYSFPQIKLKNNKFNCIVLDTKKSEYKPTEIENVNISISDISLTGATITIKDTNEKPYTYGAWYKVEKLVNGKWYNLKTIIENFGFNSMAYIPDENNEVKFVIDWEWLYGKLELGNYRILKEASNKYISVEFSIATTS